MNINDFNKPTDKLIRICGVSKKFANKVVLDNVSLEINTGEVLVIIGQSGCGKSVLLKHIIGLLKPDAGEIYFEDKKINDLDESELYNVRKQIAMVFQSAALFDSMSVYQNIAFALFEHYKYPETKLKEIVAESLALVNLSNTENYMPSELSGGMRKRVGIARAIAFKPRLLLYDEPTTGLDPITSDVINNLIIDLNQKFKTTSIIVTHDMTSAYKIADRIAMLYKGKIICVDSVDNIKNSDNPIVHQFINGLANGPITDVD